ncbi:MAG: hypothetical protein IJM53_02485 [Lachnospiraceae bacterium]|nr:hypothetical protein [Lachnospiraceae bacterium]
MKVFVFECAGRRRAQYIIYGRSTISVAGKLRSLAGLSELYESRKYFVSLQEKPEFRKLEALLKHMDAGCITLDELAGLDLRLKGFALACVDFVPETKRPVDELADEYPEAMVVM